ncbi:MAG: hypothetical protein RL325_229 [Planctomycetota bacterium]
MQTIAQRLLAALEVSRITIAFGAVANVWLVVLLARADASLAATEVATRPLWQVLAAGALVAVGFLTFGAALNDFLDAKHDRAFAPNRPLPAGRLASRRAMQIAAIALCAGMLGATAFGTGGAFTAIGLAAVILVYDAFAKHVPGLGIALSGVATAASMLVPCLEIHAVVPIWLAMSQTMGLGAIAYVLGEKRPRLTGRAVAAGFLAWVLCSVALLWLELARNEGRALEGWIALDRAWIPAAVVVVGALACAWKLRGARGPLAGERTLRYGSLWKSLVAAAWLAAADMPVAAAWIAGVAVAIFAATALLRETGPQLAEPVTWRS